MHGFKESKDAQLFLSLKPTLIKLVAEMLVWCNQRKLPFMVTSTIREMIQGVSKTDIHSDARAIDVSVVGWTADMIDAFEKEFNARFAKELGAISIDDGKARVVVFHVGTGSHFHIQIRRDV